MLELTQQSAIHQRELAELQAERDRYANMMEAQLKEMQELLEVKVHQEIALQGLQEHADQADTQVKFTAAVSDLLAVDENKWYPQHSYLW